MSGRKRGHYFKYLRCDKNQPQAKFPRQTAWNQNNKVFDNYFFPQNLSEQSFNSK